MSEPDYKIGFGCDFARSVCITKKALFLQGKHSQTVWGLLRPLLQDLVLLEKHGVYVEKLGANVKGTVSKKVSYLIRFAAFAWPHDRKYKIKKLGLFTFV